MNTYINSLQCFRIFNTLYFGFPGQVLCAVFQLNRFAFQRNGPSHRTVSISANASLAKVKMQHAPYAKTTLGLNV